jgi:FtsZ-binding cell division protein ZapB
MLAEQVAALEKRADALESRVGTAGTTSSSGAPGNEATLARLQEIKAAIEADRAEASAIKAERDALQDDNQALRKQVDKLNYRVKFLLRTIDELEGAKK